MRVRASFWTSCDHAGGIWAWSCRQEETPVKMVCCCDPILSVKNQLIHIEVSGVVSFILFLQRKNGTNVLLILIIKVNTENWWHQQCVLQTEGRETYYIQPETFCPVTLIQDAHINMPYQSWELRPLDVNKVLLTVTTVFTELQIQIKVKPLL